MADSGLPASGPPLRTCPSCATLLVPGANYCHHCGRPLADAPLDPALARLQQYSPRELLSKLEASRSGRSLDGERRIISIMYCDVKGSTELAEQLDPEDWAEIMNGAFEHLIAPVYRYEGIVARLMGDAILAVFGAPVSHEDDPQRAVLSGLDIIAGMGEYRERVRRERGEHEEANRLRQEARSELRWIVDTIRPPQLQELFLQQPRVRDLIQAVE